MLFIRVRIPRWVSSQRWRDRIAPSSPDRMMSEIRLGSPGRSHGARRGTDPSVPGHARGGLRPPPRAPARPSARLDPVRPRVAAVSGFVPGPVGGLRQLGPPFGRLVRLAPLLVKPDDTFAALRQARLAGRGNFGLAGLHALVARDDQRLGLRVLLLAQQAAAELAAGVEGAPLVGLDLLADGQAFAQDGLGLGPFSPLDEAQAPYGQDTGRPGIGGPEPLAAASRPARNNGSASGPRPAWSRRLARSSVKSRVKAPSGPCALR